VWVRELGKPSKKEFMLPGTLLDKYVGKFKSGDNNIIDVTRNGSQLSARLGGVNFVLFAESPTKFFAKTTDVQLEFPSGGSAPADRLIWSVGEGANEAKRVP
jgi:hypothetical protein